jgi:phosphatidylserine/phosphatidylglycerophosphate/cardiolipin synthase-like enzyme
MRVSDALSLVLGETVPSLPAPSLASGAAIAVCFASAAFADRVIGDAKREILVGAYGLTTGSGIVEALVRAKQRGIDVRLIAETGPCVSANGIGKT